MKTCPCHSDLIYESCCHPLHQGKPAKDAKVLMRSRYAAYALCLPDYIIKTTHSENPAYQMNQEKWASEILTFCETTQFTGLEIFEFIENEKEAFVTFKALLRQNEKDASFTEKSRFLKENHQWLYLSGTVSS